MPRSNQQPLSERLDHLEKENRRLKTGFCGAVVAAALFVMLGAAGSETGEATFESVSAKRIVVTDDTGAARLILELESGEPSLSMLNHEGMRQVHLSINEDWDDSAYLSLCSRLENGSVDKQAMLIATQTQTEGAAGFGQKLAPGNAQLLLYDRAPKQKTAAGRHLVRLASGRLDKLKPYLEVREFKEGSGGELNYELLMEAPGDDGQRLLLDTTTSPATLAGVVVGDE